MAGTVFGLGVSPNVQRVFVVAKYVKSALKLSTQSVFDGSNKTDAYLSRNPFGSIPAYESNNGVKLFESRAIAKYIDVKAGGSLLHLANPETYALVETWINVETLQFDKNAYGLLGELVFKKRAGQEPDMEKVAALKIGLFKVLDIYEKELSHREYLAGPISLADLFHLPNLTYVTKLVPEVFENRPHVKKWYEKISNLPAWKDTLAEINPPQL